MKQVILILFMFISFQMVSQSVNVPELGLEVMTTDLGNMSYYEAKQACEKLGDGWRLPTIEEIKEISYYTDRIGGFKNYKYWSSTELSYGYAWYFNPLSNVVANHDYKEYSYNVRAVRTLK